MLAVDDVTCCLQGPAQVSTLQVNTQGGRPGKAFDQRF